jgi:ribosomal protein S18 acetylase RimI-like enzyme
VSFILPFSACDAGDFRRDKVAPAVEAGHCCLLIARDDGGGIAGAGRLDLAMPPNQDHRGEVRKPPVHPEARRRGIGRSLMSAVEEEARAAGRTLLTLDTRTGDFADPLELSPGYLAIGAIPRFAPRPDSAGLDATTVMYKDPTAGG